MYLPLLFIKRGKGEKKMKRKLVYPFLIFCIVFASQVTNVLAYSRYSAYDSDYITLGDGSNCYIYGKVSIWAESFGGGVRMSQQKFEAIITINNGYGVWYKITYKIQGVTEYYEYYIPEGGPEEDPGTWLSDITTTYEYKTSAIRVYASIKVECYWADSELSWPYTLTTVEAEVEFTNYQ